MHAEPTSRRHLFQVSAAMCPPQYRGRAFAGQQVIMCSLVLCGSLSGRAMMSWRRILSLSMLPPILGGATLAASYMVKATPQTTHLEALQQDERDSTPAATGAGAESLKLALLEHLSAPSGIGPALRKALSLSLAVVMLQHMTGHSASVFFIEILLTGPGGWTDRAAAADTSLYLALLKLSCCVIAFGLLDRAGRRGMLLVGGCGASASLLLALIAFTLRSPALSATALSLTTIFFQTTFGPLGC